MNISLTKLFSEFLKSEQASGIILILCTFVSMLLANSPFGETYVAFWHMHLNIPFAGLDLPHSPEHWINDGLMAVFFLLIGLEIEREIYVGELSSPRNASLPILAAIGGMITPSLFHFALNHGTTAQSGMGIPMATDIAFALGVLALLGKAVTTSLKVFLTALAIIDDLGAIIVIALFYGGSISWGFLASAGGIFAGLIAMNRLGIKRLSLYLIPGTVMWYFMLKSGIHATITGVLLAFAIPFGKGDEDSPSYRLQHALHKPVAYLIMPIFALANTGIALRGIGLDALLSSNCVGIFMGLVAGKPLGIVLFSMLAVKFGISTLPDGVNWRHIVGVGCLGGIGFTMSIFITLQAFESASVIQASKLIILISSLVAGVIGFLSLKYFTGKPLSLDA